MGKHKFRLNGKKSNVRDARPELSPVVEIEELSPSADSTSEGESDPVLHLSLPQSPNRSCSNSAGKRRSPAATPVQPSVPSSSQEDGAERTRDPSPEANNRFNHHSDSVQAHSPAVTLPATSPATTLRKSWAEAVQTEDTNSRTRNENVKVNQNPKFHLEYLPEVLNTEGLVFSNAELDEGSQQWKYALVGCVMGTEISWINMHKFVQARWNHIAPPTIVKQSGVFLFSFQSQEDLSKIHEALTYFVFGKPLMLKRYELGMRLGKQLFEVKPVWIQLPDLQMELWNPKLLSKLISTVGKPLIADNLTVQKARLSYARVLVELHNPANPPDIIKYSTPEGTQLQKINYEWTPLPCSECQKWGHLPQDCDPNHKPAQQQTKTRSVPNQQQQRQPHQEQPTPLPKVIPSNATEVNQGQSSHSNTQAVTEYQLVNPLPSRPPKQPTAVVSVQSLPPKKVDRGEQNQQEVLETPFQMVTRSQWQKRAKGKKGQPQQQSALPSPSYFSHLLPSDENLEENLPPIPY